MITNNLDLNAMGLVSLNEAEMLDIDGGDVVYYPTMSYKGSGAQGLVQTIHALCDFLKGAWHGLAD